jgi:hypothetical protein
MNESSSPFLYVIPVTLLAIVAAVLVHTLSHQTQTVAIQEYGTPLNYRYADIGPCTIERRNFSSLTISSFMGEYAGVKPVILVRDPSEYDYQHAFTQTVSKNALLASHGDMQVTLASSNTFSHDNIYETLTTYLTEYLDPVSLENEAGDTWYLFGDNQWPELLRTYITPEFGEAYDPVLAFGIGGHHSGVPFHIHGPGFAEVVVGAKTWFLFDVEKEPIFSSLNTTLQWYENIKPTINAQEAGLYECTIGPGDVLYFPAAWYHSTLNIGDYSVFVSTFTQGN